MSRWEEQSLWWVLSWKDEPAWMCVREERDNEREQEDEIGRGGADREVNGTKRIHELNFFEPA